MRVLTKPFKHLGKIAEHCRCLLLTNPTDV